MKTLKIILVTFLFITPATLFAQAKAKGDSAYGQRVYHKRTSRKTLTTSEKDSIKTKISKSKGTSDTTVSYTVKRKKTTIITLDGNQPVPVEKTKKKQP